MQGTDQTLLSKLHQQHGSNSNYLRAKSEISMVFGLNHFAGVVFYDARGKFTHTTIYSTILIILKTDISLRLSFAYLSKDIEIQTNLLNYGLYSKFDNYWLLHGFDSGACYG